MRSLPAERLVARPNAASVVAGLAIVVGYVLVAGVVVVRAHLLEDGFYARALLRVDAYERTYTDVLGDPELADLQEQLLGRLLPVGAPTTDVRVVSASALRWTLPPDRLRAGVEEALAQVLAYLRGETDRLDTDVRIDDVLDRIDETAVVRVRTALAGAAEAVAASREDFAVALDRFAAMLEDGTIPAAVPVLRGVPMEPEAVVDLIEDLLGRPLDHRAREQVEVLLVAGEQREALITGLADSVVGHAAQIATQLRATTPGDGRLDVLDLLAERIGPQRLAAVEDANRIRDIARFFGRPTATMGAVLLAGGAVAVTIRSRRDPRRCALRLGAALVAAGTAVAVARALAAALLESPLARASSGGGGTAAQLPGGLASLIRDLDDALSDGLARTARSLALAPIATGAILIAGALVAPTLRRVRLVHALGASALVALAAGTATGSASGTIRGRRSDAATDRRSCAIAATTTWSTPPRTTPCRARTW